MEEWRYSSTILDLGTTPAALCLEKETPVPIEQEAEWVLEQVWTLWRREKSLAAAQNRIPIVQPANHRYSGSQKYPYISYSLSLLDGLGLKVSDHTIML
jgi:hypothetical protein